MVGELTTVGLGLNTPGHKVTLSMARSEEIELRENYGRMYMGFLYYSASVSTSTPLTHIVPRLVQ